MTQCMNGRGELIDARLRTVQSDTSHRDFVMDIRDDEMERNRVSALPRRDTNLFDDCMTYDL